jgi:hypothetical protein
VSCNDLSSEIDGRNVIFDLSEPGSFGRTSKRGDRYLSLLLMATAALNATNLATRMQRPIDPLQRWVLQIQQRSNYSKPFARLPTSSHASVMRYCEIVRCRCERRVSIKMMDRIENQGFYQAFVTTFRGGTNP